jgi:hypothetical protein
MAKLGDFLQIGSTNIVLKKNINALVEMMNPRTLYKKMYECTHLSLLQGIQREIRLGRVPDDPHVVFGALLFATRCGDPAAGVFTPSLSGVFGDTALTTC